MTTMFGPSSSFHSVQKTVDNDDHVINFASNKHFVLSGIFQRKLEGNTAGAREEISLHAIIHTMHGTFVVQEEW